MTGSLFPVFTELAVIQDGWQQVLTMVLSLPTLIALVGISAGAWTKISRLRLEHALKQQMIDRGMSADDIVKVLAGPRSSEAGKEGPCASEVVVETDGEWQTGLILTQEGDRYFVHIVGTEMSDNQWVSGDRVRFPAPAEGQCGAPWDWSFPSGALNAGKWCGRGNHAKPQPVDQEI